jgi:hypothetical protein
MGCGHAASSFSLLSVPPTPSIRNAIWMPSEHQPPADRISEHASEQRPEGIAESGRTQTAGESCPALRAETEPHAQDGRPHHRAANAHDEAGGEQQPNVRRETTDHRERGEDAGTDEKDASAAEHIGEPAHCEVLTLVPKVSSMAGRATESAVKSLGSRTRRPPWRSCRGSPIYRGARPHPPRSPSRLELGPLSHSHLGHATRRKFGGFLARWRDHQPDQSSSISTSEVSSCAASLVG